MCLATAWCILVTVQVLFLSCCVKPVELQQQCSTDIASDSIVHNAALVQFCDGGSMCAKAQHEGDGEERKPKSYTKASTCGAQARVFLQQARKAQHSVTVVQAACGCSSAPVSGHDIWHCWQCDNVGCHSNVAGRHPGEGQLSVAKGCADGIVSDQRQKELLGVSINILPILRTEANIIQDKNTLEEGGAGRD